MLKLVHSNHQTTLSTNALIIIENAVEDDYFNLANEDLKIEFDGVCLYIHSPATKRHEDLVFEILKSIKNFLNTKPEFAEAIGSRFALKLPNGKRPEPDVVVVKWGDVKDDDSIYEGIPLLVIEITSTSTRNHDYTRKLLWYKEAKIPEIWIIDRDQTQIKIYLHKNNAKGYVETTIERGILESQVLQNFTIDVKKLLD